MYAVIFRAKIRQLDDQYHTIAQRMRSLAMDRYGCTDFVATTIGDEELAISYWPSLAQIEVWRQDMDHVLAQQLGKSKWYSSFEVQTMEIIRRYSSEAESDSA